MFSNVIEGLIFASVAIGVIKSYLTINKVWSRKDNSSVAESISVFAAILGLIATAPFFIKYAFIDADYKSAFNAMIGLLAGMFFLLVGSGYWVKTPIKKESFWSKLKRALRLEKKESGDLVKALIMPKGADKILDILNQMALIDQRIDDKEIEFIQMFADSWRIRFDPEKLVRQQAKKSQEASYIILRDSVEGYLQIEPPTDQAAELRDVINSLAEVDNEISEQEEFLLSEVNSMLDNYVANRSNAIQYEVIIAPQSNDHDDLINRLFPGLPSAKNKGGRGYVAGRFYSLAFARMVCEKYRSANLFTAVEVMQN